jgi:hypothetical protein
MSAVEVELFIDAPPERIWEVALDPARLGDWVTIHRSLGDHDDPPAFKGFHMSQTMTLRGVPLTVDWKLVRCEEPTYAEWAGKGPARSRATTSYRLTPKDGGTLFAYYNEFKTPLGPLGAVAQRAIAGDMPESEAIASLERLRRICE